MEITLNGESRHFASGTSVADLLTSMGLDARAVVVERNLEIVPKSDADTVFLSDGDTIEIVRLVSGG